MAKKTKKEVPQKVDLSLKDKLRVLDKISNNFNNKKGKVVCGRLSTNEELVKKLTIEYVPTPSFNLNEAMGGGFPRSRCSLVVGNADSGKLII